MVSLHMNNIDLALIDQGDYGVDSPTQSIMDQQIVSVQNTRQMQWSTRKHIVEQHLNSLAANGNVTAQMILQDARNGSLS